jgi:hypothetical protein
MHTIQKIIRSEYDRAARIFREHPNSDNYRKLEEAMQMYVHVTFNLKPQELTKIENDNRWSHQKIDRIKQDARLTFAAIPPHMG